MHLYFFFVSVRLSGQVGSDAAAASKAAEVPHPVAAAAVSSAFTYTSKNVRGRSRNAGRGGAILPEFEEENTTTVVGSPGGTVTLDCNIFMLQDFTVSLYIYVN